MMTSELKGALRNCDLHEDSNGRLDWTKSQMCISMESNNEDIRPTHLGS